MPGAQEVDLRRRELGPEIHVGAVGVIVILEVVDDGHIGKQLGQEERRAEPAVADDQVGAKLGMGLACLEDAVRSARCCSRRSGCNSGSTRGRRPRPCTRIFRMPATSPGGVSETKRARPAALLHQVAGDVAELGGEVLVDEEDVHLRFRNMMAPSRQRSPLNNFARIPQRGKRPLVRHRQLIGQASSHPDACLGGDGRENEEATSAIRLWYPGNSLREQTTKRRESDPQRRAVDESYGGVKGTSILRKSSVADRMLRAGRGISPGSHGLSYLEKESSMASQHVGELTASHPHAHSQAIPGAEAHGGAHGGSLAALAFGALGVVFGDIGTSPLYTLKECLHAAGGDKTGVVLPICSESSR